MNKNEFLSQLKMQLSFSLDKQKIEENIKYYRDYIENEIKNGKSEQEVLNELGSPNLIAKTIVQINNNNKEVYNENLNQNNDREDKNDNFFKSKKHFFSTNISSAGCVLIFLILFLIIMLLFRFLNYLLFANFLGISFPLVVLIIFIIYYFITMIKK